jgi:hypothetical protein
MPLVARQFLYCVHDPASANGGGEIQMQRKYSQCGAAGLSGILNQIGVVQWHIVRAQSWAQCVTPAWICGVISATFGITGLCWDID